MSQDTPPSTGTTDSQDESQENASGIKLASKPTLPPRPVAPSVPPPPPAGRPTLQRPPVPTRRPDLPAVVTPAAEATSNTSVFGAVVDVIVLVAAGAACVMMLLEFLAKNVK